MIYAFMELYDTLDMYTVHIYAISVKKKTYDILVWKILWELFNGYIFYSVPFKLRVCVFDTDTDIQIHWMCVHCLNCKIKSRFSPSARITSHLYLTSQGMRVSF